MPVWFRSVGETRQGDVVLKYQEAPAVTTYENQVISTFSSPRRSNIHSRLSLPVQLLNDEVDKRQLFSVRELGQATSAEYRVEKTLGFGLDFGMAHHIENEDGASSPSLR